MLTVRDSEDAGWVEVVDECGRCALVRRDSVKWDGHLVSAPASGTTSKQVTELVELLRPFAAGEEGDSDVVARVRRLLGELVYLRNCNRLVKDSEEG